jgi:hypothetical protein
MKPKLIPRDVVTQWNSTYDMLRCALAYRQAIDIITADKALKLRKYELNDEHWDIIGDLVAVLEVCISNPVSDSHECFLHLAIQKGNYIFLS